MESRINPKDDDEDSCIKEHLDRLTEDIKKLPLDRLEKLGNLVKSMNKQVLSIKEAANIFGVSPDTIRRSIKSGDIKAFQLKKGSVWRVPISEIERFLKGE